MAGAEPDKPSSGDDMEDEAGARSRWKSSSDAWACSPRTWAPTTLPRWPWRPGCGRRGSAAACRNAGFEPVDRLIETLQRVAQPIRNTDRHCVSRQLTVGDTMSPSMFRQSDRCSATPIAAQKDGAQTIQPEYGLFPNPG